MGVCVNSQKLTLFIGMFLNGVIICGGDNENGNNLSGCRGSMSLIEGYSEWEGRPPEGSLGGSIEFGVKE